MDYLDHLLGTSPFMPHSHCYAMRQDLILLHLVSDASIWLAYMVITATILYMIRRIRNLPFQWMYLMFGAFIIACGFTHLLEVITLYHPIYWVSGGVKAVTAVASVGTAVLMFPLIPKAVELAGMYEKSRELEAVKTQFFANVSHELRTPLALILGPTEKLLALPDLAAEQRRSLEVVDRNARTLLKHVNDLLDVSKLEAGRMEVRFAKTDLARLVRLGASHFEGLAADREVAFAVEAPGTLPAEVDQGKLERVLLNLLSNAFKFTPARGKVRVTLAAEGERVRLEVADSGPGISPEFRPHLFERFRQADGAATRRFGGTGLGLAIAKDFVTLHRGTIDATRAPEGGALLTVILPLRAPDGAVVEAEVASVDSAPRDALVRASLEELKGRIEAAALASGSSARARVLVVEDNVEMNRFVAESLADEYEVATAHDGAEGLAKALATKPDLVLSDIMMPRMSGDQLVAAIRGEPALAGVPVVLLTAKADDDLRVKLLREGAQDYIMKPFSVEEVRARVANLVTMKRARDILQRELESQVRDLESLATEVTSRKRELHSALEGMRVAREHAERASEVKSNFLNMVSHELRSPVTTFSLNLQLMERDKDTALTPRQAQLLKKMARASGRLLELIESLLEYARVSSTGLARRVETFDPREVAKEVLAEQEDRGRELGLDVRLEAPETLPPLTRDRRLVRLVVSNLLDNALKYTRKGSIVVSLGHERERWRFAVRDTGLGIPADKTEEIFRPWTQLERVEHKHSPGVGLGLALVREIVAALGGAVTVESTPGEGSTFTVTFPAMEPSAVVA